ncbi:hypothetical protein AGR6A_pAt50014 [Agrobacterium sp. NCPPB 925]|nr:hypothetical protein AGR6A_pAt50014 [Agrobacterium sp. NCPPB 925]
MAGLVPFEPFGIRVDFPRDESITGGDMDWEFVQSSDRIEEHAQRFGGVRSAVHPSLFLSIVGLREQLTHQFDEHRYRVVHELLAKLDDLSHDQSVAATGVEVVGKPGRGCVALPDRLVPPSG